MQLICMLRKMKTITFAKELDKMSLKMATREKIHWKRNPSCLQNHKIVTLYSLVTFEKRLEF